MADLIALTDHLAAQYFDFFLRTMIWGFVCGVASMWLYTRFAPHLRLSDLKQQQKAARARLLAHEGTFRELRPLMRADITLSLKLCCVAIPAVALSALPVVALLFSLTESMQAHPYPMYGPEWTGSFEFWYLLSVLAGSLLAKCCFRTR